MGEPKNRTFNMQMTQTEHEMFMVLKINKEKELGRAVALREIMIEALTEKYGQLKIGRGGNVRN